MNSARQNYLFDTVEKEENAVPLAFDFYVGFITAKVNSISKTMDVPVRLINDKTMVPLRFLSEELGYTVSWDEDTRMITITTE